MKEKMSKQRLNFKIPEVCNKPCLKHCDVSCCVVTYPLKVVCVKRNTEALCTHRCSVPIQEARELSSGDVLLSLLTGNRNDKKAFMLPEKNGVLTQKNSGIRSKPEIKHEHFDIDYHSSFHKIPPAVLQISHQRAADIVPKINILNNGMMPNTPYPVSTNIQLWFNTLTKLHFAFLALHNNFPTLTSPLLFSISIKSFMSKLMSLKSRNFRCSEMSSLQSEFINPPQMESSNLQLQNDYLTKEIISKIFKKLVSSSLYLLSELYFEIKYLKPLNMDICLFNQVYELPFIVVSHQHDLSMRFKIVFIPALDTSSNITNFNTIVKEYSTVPLQRQCVKNLSEQSSWSLMSGHLHKYGSAWCSELCKIILNSSTTSQFSSNFTASMTLFSYIFFPCDKTFPTLVISKNNLSIHNPTRNGEPFSWSIMPDFTSSSANYHFNRTRIAESDCAQVTEKIKTNFFNDSGQLQICNKFSINAKLNEFGEFCEIVQDYPNNLIKAANVSRQTIQHLSGESAKSNPMAKHELNISESSLFKGNVEDVEFVYHQETSRKPSHFALNGFKRKFSELACDEICTDENYYSKDIEKKLGLTANPIPVIKKQFPHIASNDMIKNLNLSSENVVPQMKSLLNSNSEGLYKEKKPLPAVAKVISIKNNSNANPFIALQAATAMKINIATESISGAKHKFCDLVYDEMMEAEILSSKNFEPFQKNLLNSKSSYKDYHLKEKDLLKATSLVPVENNLSTVLAGFQTAAGKQISVSEKAINIIKSKFSDISHETEEAKMLFPTNSKFLGKDMLNLGSNFEENQKDKIFSEKANSIAVMDNIIKAPFVGFQTATGKRIKVSDKAIDTVKNQFSNFISNEALETEMLYVSLNSDQKILPASSPKKNLKIDNLLSQEGNTISVNDNLNRLSFDFQTAAGKKINVSEKAITDIKNKFSDMFDDMVETGTLSSTNSDPLQKILRSNCNDHSKETFGKTCGILTENSLSKVPLSTFQTSFEQKTCASKETLNTVKSKFSDIVNNEVISHITSQPLHKALSKPNSKCPIEENSLLEKKADAIFVENNLKSPITNFQTAVGKRISVSEKTAVKRKFSDITSDEVMEKKTLSSACTEFPQNTLFSSLSNSYEFSKINKHLSKETNLYSDEDNLNKTFLGLQTSSGKVVASEKAVNDVKDKFSNMLNDMVETETLCFTNSDPLRKILKSSSNIHSKETDQLEDKTYSILIENDLNNKIPSFSLQTAIGKKNCVSEEALNAVKKKILNARNSKVMSYNSLSSSIGLQKINNHLPEEFNLTSDKNNSTKTFLNFQTAAGSEIKISDKALNSVKNKFFGMFDEMTGTENPYSVKFDSLPQKVLLQSSPNQLSEENHPNQLSEENQLLAEKTDVKSVGNNLNKTTLMDFQTDSTKKYSICKKDINDAHDKLLHIIPCEMVENETVFFTNSESFQKSVSWQNCNEAAQENQFPEKTGAMSNKNYLEKIPLVDCQTGPGRRINISEKTLNIIKNKFSDIIPDEMVDAEMQSVVNSEYNHQDKLLSSQSNIQNHSSGTPNTCFENKRAFIGFHTAAGKSVEVSEKALNVTKRKFSEIFNTELMESERLNAKTMEIFNLKSGSENLVKESISLSEVLTPGSFPESNLKSLKFQTAAGKDIDDSTEALDVIKAKFPNKYINENSVFNKVENLQPVSILSKHPDLEQQLNSVNYIEEENLLDKKHNLDENLFKSAFMGFQTAAGKNVEVSEENLNLVKRKFSNLLAGDVKDEEITSMDTELVQTELSSALSSEKNIYKKESPSFLVSNSNANKIIKFQTAAGKNINVSEKALRHVKSKFENVFAEGNSGDAKLSSADFESTSMKQLTSCCSIENGQEICEVPLSSPSRNDIGFQTATRKNISVSENTLNVVKRKFCDLLDEETAQCVISNSVVKSLLNYDYSLKTDPEKKQFCTKSDAFSVKNLSVGFQTAAGKTVSISDEALNTVKNKFSHSVCDSVIENELLADTKKVIKLKTSYSGLENTANKKLCSNPANVSCIMGYENTFNGIGEFPRKNGTVLKTTVNQSAIHLPFNEIVETKKSVLADSKIPNSNTTFKRPKIWQPDRIEILNFDYCKCFPKCDKNSPNFSPFSNENSLSEYSFICSDCHKPCKFAVHFVHKKPKFYDLLHANFIHRKVHKRLYSITMHKQQHKRSDHVLGQKYKISNLPLSNTVTIVNNNIESIQPANIIFQVEKLREQQACRIARKEQIKIMSGQLAILKRDCHKPTCLRNFTAKSPPGDYTSKQLLSFGVKQHSLDVNSTSAEGFVFKEEDFREYTSTSPYCFTVGDNALVILDDSKCAGKKELFSAFLDSPGVDPSLISDKWFYNHYRWIVWKLASLEFSFPSLFGGNYLTPHHVMLQMKFRYDYEVDNSKRSVFKRIIERDDTPSKTLVLFVSSISKCEIQRSENEETVFQMKLSDGWYEIQAKIDAAMENLIKKNKIYVGCKIITSGAELCGSDVACSPLEIPDSLYLKIHTNSTRIARWDVKLGYFPHRRPFAVPIASILPDGGCIGHIHIIVNRVYPILYLEKYGNGSQITRNEKMEFKAQEQYQKLQGHHLNRIRQSVCKAFEERSQKKTIKMKQSSHRYKLVTGEELFEAFNCAIDIQAFLESLDVDQIATLKEFEKKHMEKKYFEMEKEINKAIIEAKNIGECLVDRNVTPVLKVFVKGCHVLDHHSNIDIILNIWRPSSDILELFVEGTALEIFYLYPSRYQNDIIHLNSIKTTCYEKINLERTLMEKIYQSRKVTELGDIAKHCNDSVIDIIGFIFHVTDSSENIRSKDMIYVTDTNFNSLVIKFPDSFSSTGCQDFLKIGNVIAVCNLKLDMNPNNFPVCSTATLITTFSCNPKAIYLNEAMENLKQQIKDPGQFIKQAKIILENELKKYKKFKYRFNNMDNINNNNNSERQRSRDNTSTIIYNQPLNTPDGVTNQRNSFSSKCQPKKLFTSVEERLFNLGTVPSPAPLPRVTINASLSARADFKSPKWKTDRS